MRLTLTIVVMLLGITSAVACETQARPFRSGAYTGSDLNGMSENLLSIHISGYINGLLVSPLLGADTACYSKMYECLEGRTGPQLTAIVRKHLADNPERWHQPANVLTYQALIAPCTNPEWE